MSSRVPRLLRAFAIVLALICAWDPAVTSSRNSRPVVAVVTSDSLTEGPLAARVGRALSGKFEIIRAPFAAASATVLVGDRVPGSTTDLASPLFAVVPERATPGVAIEAVRAPERSPLEARTAIEAVTRTSGAEGRMLDVTLRVGGVVMDEARRRVATDDDRQLVQLAFVPTATGAIPVRVTARIDSSSRSVDADVLIDVRDTRWAVLFYDPRPSWMSTFVRRAVESDPRFAVTSRVVTSRNVSTDAGQPPGSLDDLATLDLFDVIVVGAPESLSERDIGGLDAFLRRHGGGVVLLLDQRERGPYERLLDVDQWAGTTSGMAMHVDAVVPDMGGLRAGEIAWPDRLPAGAEPLARNVPPSGDTLKSRPVVWRTAVGAGRLVVSGALDAWRTRDSATSAFDTFWQSTIAATAEAGSPPIDIHLAKSLARPGEADEVTVTVRGAALAELTSGRPVRASVGATLVSLHSADASTNIRLWPDGPVGQFRGSFRVPAAAGAYGIDVSGNGVLAHAPLIVTSDVSRPVPDERDLVVALTAARGGTAVPAAHLGDLAALLAGAVQPTRHLEEWHPMRSAWWIIPFALALGVEWWWRRRRGLA